MTILTNMPIDGTCAGHINVGDYSNPGESLFWGTVRPVLVHPLVPATATSKPAGVISVRCFKHGFNTHIISQDSILDKGLGMNSHNLYWLPWGDGTVASVTWAGLAGTNLFLTSTFSGCRFVVNDTGVAHVAWGTHGGGHAHGSSHGRDYAEVTAASGNPTGGGRRRALSVTGAVPGRVNEQRLTYDINLNQCVVIGWKTGNRWTFKCLKMIIASPMKSRWTTIAEVDVVGGVANIV